MTPVPLHDDIEALAAAWPAALPIARRLRSAATAQRAGLVAEVAGIARLDTFRTLALLLKVGWESRGRPCVRWRPWDDTAPLAACLPDARSVEAADGGLALMVLDLCAQYAHMAGLQPVAELAERDGAQRAVLARGESDERHAFARDKHAWLEAELELDELVDLRQQVVAEIESTRFQYLAITGAAAIALVESARKLAVAHYRLAFDDPTMTPEEVDARLANDRDDHDAPAGPLGALEPELLLALRDSVQGIHGDQRALRHIAHLVQSGLARPASEEDLRTATLLFRRLARLCHPDCIPPDARVAPGNRARLAEIWHAASATHGARVQLSHDKLVSYVQHLGEWITEAERIRRALALPAPSRLLAGGTLAELQDDLARAMADVQRHLHAVRDDVSTLEFDPLHFEYRRVIAMGPAEREAECTCMRERAARWEREAERVQAQIDAGPPDRSGPGETG